ncbi:MAG TPA: hypothetical protein VGE52_20570 [Pirellulales bacterium]
MASPIEPESNPYAAPVAETIAPVEAVPSDQATLKSFRRNIVGLGVFWIILGLIDLAIVPPFLPTIASAPPPVKTKAMETVAFLVAIGLAWLVFGVAACRKQLWAVYAGAAVNYLGLLSVLVQGNFCAVVFVGAVIAQCHITINLANKLRAAGVPLDAVPARV